MRISVVVPVYNTDTKTLRECINSLYAQDYEDYEIIIVDDGSNNVTKLECERICNERKRVKLFRQDNKGVSVARNYGIRIATGDVVVFVDSDDWCGKGCFTFINKNMGNHDVLIFDAFMVRYSKCIRNRFFYQRKEFLEGDKVELLSQCINYKYSNGYKPEHHGVGSVMCKVYSRNFLVDNDLHFPIGQKNSEDAAFNFCVFSKAKSVIYIPEAFYYYREDNTSVSRSFDAKYIDTCSTYLTEFRNLINSNNFSDNIELNKAYMSRIVTAVYSIFDVYIVNLKVKDIPETVKNLKSKRWIIEYQSTAGYISPQWKIAEFPIKKGMWWIMVVGAFAKKFARKWKAFIEKSVNI